MKSSAHSTVSKIETVGVTAQSEVTQAVDTLIKKKVDCFSNLTDNNVVGVLPAILEKQTRLRFLFTAAKLSK